MMIFEWIRANEILIAWMGIISTIAFFATLIGVSLLVVRIPEDYFMDKRPGAARVPRRHPALIFFSMIIKNMFGYIFIAAGIIMLFMPGQGIITILIGITLVNFPGKRSLERRIISRPGVLKAINWMRARANTPPLKISETGYFSADYQTN